MELIVKNKSASEALEFEDCLHTYFAVDDVTAGVVAGEGFPPSSPPWLPAVSSAVGPSPLQNADIVVPEAGRGVPRGPGGPPHKR